ncbi:MAG: peptidoglycan editing factor PgeF [Bacteroidota bacterium]
MNRVLHSSILDGTGLVRFAFSTRVGGNDGSHFGMNTSFNVGDAPENVRASRQELLASIGSTPDQLALPMQVHSAIVRRVESAGNYPECDGLLTSSPDICLGVSTADCVPIFILDPAKAAIAGVHAGWRGTAGGIVTQAIVAMQAEFGSRPADLIAFIGPCADVCCYQVGDEVASRFDNNFVVRKEGAVLLSLKAANVSALSLSGVPLTNIEVSPHCTISESHLFHSYRRDKERSGRMMGVIRLIR